MVSTRDIDDGLSLSTQLKKTTNINDIHEIIENLVEQMNHMQQRSAFADVADGVFHNMGNVLNSLNVTLLNIHSRVKAQKHQELSKLNNLISRLKPETEFLKSHPKGKLIPSFVEDLTTSLIEESEEIYSETQKLKSHVTHLRELVAGQQDMLGGDKKMGLENYSIDSIIEESIHLAKYSRESSLCDVEYTAQPDLVIQSNKNKIVQILVNFLTNANQSYRDRNHSNSTIFVKSGSLDNDVIFFEVEDKGAGISAENLEKLFTHGFTTKENGNGFGLHSCRRLAAELGGHIEAESDGIGQGAKFRLFIQSK